MFRPLLYTMTLAGVMLASPSFAHAKLAPSRLIMAGRAIPMTVDRGAPASKTVVVPMSALAPGNDFRGA